MYMDVVVTYARTKVLHGFEGISMKNANGILGFS